MHAVCRGISLKEKLSNYLLVAILQAMLAVCRGISLEEKLSNYLLEAILQAMLAVCMGIKCKIKILQGEGYGHKSSAVGKTEYSGFTANL